VDSISCDRSRRGRRYPRGARAVKIVVLARSYADLRRLIEPLVDHPLLAVRMDHPDDAPVLLARLDLADNLMLYVFGALVPTPPEALHELATGAIGAVVVDGTEGSARPLLAGLPAVVTTASGPSGVVPRQFTPVRDAQARARAKQPFTALVRAAIEARSPGYGSA
jgi:hypothetical protein